MSKTSGLGMGLYIAGVDVSGDIGSFGNIQGGNSPLDLTGIDKLAPERQGGVRSGSVDYTAFFNTTGVHTVLKSLPTADQLLTGRIGAAIGAPAFSVLGKQIDYNPKRGTDGSLIFDVHSQSNAFGLQWGDLLTAGIRTDTTATNGPGFNTGYTDLLPSYQMYVHLLAFTGTNVTIKLQESDDGSGDPYTDSGATTGALATAPATSRSAGTSPNIGQFIRVVTTGTFTSASFVVMVATGSALVVF